jgi:hypothetical protein
MEPHQTDNPLFSRNLKLIELAAYIGSSVAATILIRRNIIDGEKEDMGQNKLFVEYCE